jgi:hypothetical protein
MTLERRTPLKRTGGPKVNPAKARDWQDRSRQPIPKTSTKGAQRKRAAAEAGQRAKERDGRCIAAELVPELRCWGPLDPQHVIPRSTAPELVSDLANIVACCRGHHDWIGGNPEAARLLGLHGHAGDDLDELAARRKAL